MARRPWISSRFNLPSTQLGILATGVSLQGYDGRLPIRGISLSLPDDVPVGKGPRSAGRHPDMVGAAPGLQG